MKNPQTQNGFTMIANELMDALWRIRISGDEVRMLNYIFRKTYGYKKKTAEINLTEFCTGTGMKKPNAIRTIKKLLEKNIIIKNDNNYGINKDNDSWKPLSKKITKVIKNDNKAEEKESNKEKEYILNKKEILTNVSTQSEEKALVKVYGNPDINECKRYFLEKMIIPVEDCSQKQSRQYWSLLLRESKTGVEGVKWLIDTAKADAFHAPNITSSKDLYYKRVKLISRLRGSQHSIAVMPKEVSHG